MKTLKQLIIAAIFIFAGVMQAQVSVNVHIGNPPPWGPVGYSNVRWYYLPDVDAYYDVVGHRYVYISGNVWVRHTHLPLRYRNYDLYRGRKVVITNYRGDAPYKFYKVHKHKYARGSRGEMYRTNERGSNKEYRKDNKNDRRSKDHGNGRGHGNGKR